MKSIVFLKFLEDYSYPIDYYSFVSAEDESSSDFNEKDPRLYYLSEFSAKLIHTTLQKSGFVQTDDFRQASIVVGSRQNENLQKYLKPYQKMTHFLYTNVIGQKVGLHNTLTKYMKTTGVSLPFYPKTFLVPEQLDDFKRSASSVKFWIEKPSCGSCGRGITIVEGVPETFITRQVVMQEYIRNPLLIKGYKFDLRFYVAVTSINPLRIYIYNDGLVRFATEKYGLFFEDVSNLSAHLTNFSINKVSENFHVTNDIKNDGKGSKWSHVPFWPFLDQLNFDVDDIKKQIEDAISTVIFAARDKISLQINNRSSFELYGVDVLLDCDGDIHILEFNVSPALGTSSNLDMHIKAPLVRDLFNIALIPKKTEASMRIEAAFSVKNKEWFRKLMKKREDEKEQNQNQQNQNENQQNKNQQSKNENQQNKNENQQNKNQQNQNENQQNQNENQQNKNQQNQNENQQNQNENQQNQNENQQNQNENQQNKRENVQNKSQQDQNHNHIKYEKIKELLDSFLLTEKKFSTPVLSDVASLASVCEFEIAEQRLGGFRRIYPTVERARKFDEIMGDEDSKTDLDRVLEEWLISDEEKKDAFIRSKIPSYRSVLGDLVSFPHEFCHIA